MTTNTLREQHYTCCENGMLSQVPPTDASGLCPDCKLNQHNVTRAVAQPATVQEPVAWRCPHCIARSIKSCPHSADWRSETTPPAAPVLHPDDVAVDSFAAAMKAKMAKRRAKGYGGWNDKDDCPTERLQTMLADHLAKGDPIDVGNFAMMLWARGDSTASLSGAQSAAVPKDYKLVPVDPTEEMVEAAKGGAILLQSMEWMFRRGVVANWSAMLAAAPPAQPAPVLSVVHEELTDSQIMASVGRCNAGISESTSIGQQWEQVCVLFRHVMRERGYTTPLTQSAAAIA